MIYIQLYKLFIYLVIHTHTHTHTHTHRNKQGGAFGTHRVRCTKRRSILQI